MGGAELLGSLHPKVLDSSIITVFCLNFFTCFHLMFMFNFDSNVFF